MAQELFRVPSGLFGDLREEGAVMAAFDDIDAVTAQFELFDGLDLFEGRKDGDLDVDLVRFISGKRGETRVVEGCM